MAINWPQVINSIPSLPPPALKCFNYWHRGQKRFPPPPPPPPHFCRIINNYLLFYHGHLIIIGLKNTIFYKTLIDWVSNELVGFPAFNFAVQLTNFHFFNNTSLYIGKKLFCSEDQLHSCMLVHCHKTWLTQSTSLWSSRRSQVQMNKEGAFWEVQVNVDLSV